MTTITTVLSFLSKQNVPERNEEIYIVLIFSLATTFMDKKNLIARALITGITSCYVKRSQLKQPGLRPLKFEDKTFNMEVRQHNI